MTRTDQDSWDLASSVGATATMVAAARALASEGANPIINDPFAAPLVRAVGLDFFRRLVDGDSNWSRPMPTTAPNGPAAGNRFDRGAHPLLRRLLPQRRPRRHPPVGDPGRRPRRARVPAGLAARERRLRGRSAQGRRVQDRRHGDAGRHPDRGSADRQRRSARRLAGRVAPQRIRHDATNLMERRGLADVPAARGPGPALRQHHRAQRARQHAGHRIPRRFRPDDERTRAGSSTSGGPNSGATSTCRGCSSTASAAMSWTT